MLGIYRRLPNRMMVDQGEEFGNHFVRIASKENVIIRKNGIKAHSILGLCERFRQTIRTTYRKLKLETPKICKHLPFEFSVKTINDISGPDGFVTSELVFGEFPPSFTKSEKKTSRPINSQRVHLMIMTRKDMGKILAEMWIKRETPYALPPAADRCFETGDLVFI